MAESEIREAVRPAHAEKRTFHLDLAPDLAEWARFGAGMARLRRLTPRLDAGDDIAMPFFVVTPEGLDERVRLRDTLLLDGIHVLRRLPVPNWPRAYTILTLDCFEEEDLLRAYAYEEMWRLLHPGTRAECWFLWSPQACCRLTSYGPQLAAGMACRESLVTVRGRTFPVSLAAVHVPSPERLDHDFRRLRWLLENS